MDLRPYLTGEPVWFVRGSLCLRIPLPGFTKKGQGFKPPPVELPEAQVFAVLARRRRGLVNWLQRQDDPATLCAVMNGAVAIAMNSPGFACTDWAPSANRPRGVYGAESEGITLDCQSAEVLYRKSAIKPVPDSMTAFEDFELVFGASPCLLTPVSLRRFARRLRRCLLLPSCVAFDFRFSRQPAVDA